MGARKSRGALIGHPVSHANTLPASCLKVSLGSLDASSATRRRRPGHLKVSRFVDTYRSSRRAGRMDCRHQLIAGAVLRNEGKGTRRVPALRQIRVVMDRDEDDPRARTSAPGA